MKTSELTGVALDWAVATCEGKAGDCEVHAGNVWYGRATSGFVQYTPSTDWAQGGPIIEREQLFVCPYDPLGMGWRCTTKAANYALPSEKQYHAQFGQTPLIAAMRCYVASKLGDDVTIPEGLV